MNKNRIGQTATVNGLQVRVVGIYGGEYEIHSVGGFGVWFATEEQAAAVFGA